MQAQKRAILQRISIHAPARGATRSLFRIAKAGSYFNPRSREGSDQAAICVPHILRYFNPRSREGSDRSVCHHAGPDYQFQSTLPRGERQCNSPANVANIMDFNPRSREGSDVDVPDICDHMQYISIHAPARGATREQALPFKPDIFQSTLPRGERRIFLQFQIPYFVISIHAPARGATKSTFLHSIWLAISIHAPARGATVFRDPFMQSAGFQSTLPRGERLQYVCFKFCICVISIHAPARGATISGILVIAVAFLFQSTLPRGERLQFYLKFTLCF